MTSNHAAVWINHRHAVVLHISRDGEEISDIHSAHGHEHLHHKADTVGDGNALSHPAFFHDVVKAVGASNEVLVLGPADAKLELMKHAKRHDAAFAKRVIKVETMDRATTGELINHARRFFGMPKKRLGPHHAAGV